MSPLIAQVSEILLWLGIALLAYVYGGYLQVLRLLAAIRRPPDAPPAPAAGDAPAPDLTVLITVHNEEGEIADRVRNVLDCDYPAERLQVIVASDASDDGTDGIVRGFRDARVQLARPERRMGKTGTQNWALGAATGDIVVFTDAETRFAPSFLQAIVAPFRDLSVGAVDGHLLLGPEAKGAVARAQSSYWSHELHLREAESRLGLLAVGSGACLAVRRGLLQPVNSAYGEDCVVPLDVVAQGYRMAHAETAVAWDRMPAETTREFRTRARMTARNWRGTWSRPELLNPLRHPGYAFALWSHKLLRWLSPLFLLVSTAAAAVLAPTGALYALIFAALAALYVAAGIGGAAARWGWRLPLAGTAYSFVLANFGFMAGLLHVVVGTRISQYGRS